MFIVAVIVIITTEKAAAVIGNSNCVVVVAMVDNNVVSCAIGFLEVGGTDEKGKAGLYFVLSPSIIISACETLYMRVCTIVHGFDFVLKTH